MRQLGLANEHTSPGTKCPSIIAPSGGTERGMLNVATASLRKFSLIQAFTKSSFSSNPVIPYAPWSGFRGGSLSSTSATNRSRLPGLRARLANRQCSVLPVWKWWEERLASFHSTL